MAPAPTDLKASALRGVAWTSLSYGLRYGAQTLIGILVARVLLPEQYGVFALATLALGVVSLLANLGLGTAIVREPEVTQRQLSSAFWFNVGLGLALALALVLAAPAIAAFFAEPRVVPVLLLLAPNFLLGNLTVVHSSLLSRHRNYRSLALRETYAALLGGAVAVAMAYAGSGVYSLVGQAIASNLFSILFFWRSDAWRPSWLFDWPALQALFRFGIPLAGSNVLGWLTRNLDNLLVGRFLGTTALGLYGFVYAIIQAPVYLVQSILGQVMFPELARVKHDLPHVRAVYVGTNRYIAAALWLPLGGFLVLAPVAVPLLYGPQWSPAIPLLQLFSLVAIAQTLSTTTGWIYTSQGKTRLQFWLGIPFSLAIYASFIVGLRWGLIGVTVAYTAVNYLLMWGNAFAFRIIGLRMRDFLRALATPALALVHLCAVLYIGLAATQIWWPGHPLVVLIGGALLGTVVYVLVLWLADPALLRGLTQLPRQLVRSRAAPTPVPEQPQG
jgi:PST family polysaccharide transporter